MHFAAFERYRRAVGLAPREVTAEEQGSDYESGRVVLDGSAWRIRTARITPAKPGAFVAVWRRAPEGGTEPFDSADECAGLMVFVADAARFGVFAFTQAHLEELGVLRSASSAGKRGFRLYPSWCGPLNAQATRTQKAQLSAFTDLTS